MYWEKKKNKKLYFLISNLLLDWFWGLNLSLEWSGSVGALTIIFFNVLSYFNLANLGFCVQFLFKKLVIFFSTIVSIFFKIIIVILFVIGFKRYCWPYINMCILNIKKKIFNLSCYIDTGKGKNSGTFFTPLKEKKKRLHILITDFFNPFKGEKNHAYDFITVIINPSKIKKRRLHIFTSVISGVISTISSAASAAVDAVKGAASAVKNWVSKKIYKNIYHINKFINPILCFSSKIFESVLEAIYNFMHHLICSNWEKITRIVRIYLPLICLALTYIVTYIFYHVWDALFTNTVIFFAIVISLVLIYKYSKFFFFCYIYIILWGINNYVGVILNRFDKLFALLGDNPKAIETILLASPWYFYPLNYQICFYIRYIQSRLFYWSCLVVERLILIYIAQCL